MMTSRMWATAMAAIALSTSGCSLAPAVDAVDAGAQPEPERLVPAGPRLRVVLMSSLALVHGEGVDMTGMIAGRSTPHPLYRALRRAHTLIVADALDRDVLAGADLAILIQPHALPPSALVALDAYVRGGGHLLLFADPALAWPHGAGLAGAQGPLRSSLISPLLEHWGIELIDPDREWVRLRPSGALLVHPGQFAALAGKTGDADCTVEPDGHVARCDPGLGRAVLVADADLIDPALIRNSADSAVANRRFVAALIRELTQPDTS